MRNLKAPQGVVKKGIARFSLNATQAAISPGTEYNLFETVNENSSNNIIKLGPSRIKLLKGNVFSIKVMINACGFSNATNGHQWWDIYNCVDGVSIPGQNAISLPITFSSTWAPLPYLEKIITCDKDIEICIKGTSGVGTLDLPDKSCGVIVEELESHLIPVDPTQYTETVNLIEATGTYKIPSGLPIKTKKLIRKIHSDEAPYTIVCEGETFTRSALASISLNSDGDFWLVEKVSKTRWELVDGRETGTNNNGNYRRYADGLQRCMLKTNVTNQAISTVYGVLFVGSRDWVYPKAFSTMEGVVVTVGVAKWYNQASWGSCLAATENRATLYFYDVTTRVTGQTFSLSVSAEGKWY